MQLRVSFLQEAGSKKDLPDLKSPQNFTHLPQKGDVKKVLTKCGKKIFVQVVSLNGHRTGISLVVIPKNGVVK